MKRYKIKIEYDGTPFIGWQRQDNGLSVQECIETAIESLFQEKPTLFGAGRTDSGVHATGQAAHLDVPSKYTTRSVMMGLNSYLDASPISILSAEKVDAEFNARFDAIERRYLYRISTRNVRPSLNKFRVWHITKELDIEAMRSAARHLVGTHDFTSFRASQCQAKSPVRTMESIEIEKVDDEIHIKAIARSFLHNQIRNITGSLVEVGKGRWQSEKIKEIRDAKDRQAAGPAAPPHGLYLTDVIYTR